MAQSALAAGQPLPRARRWVRGVRNAVSTRRSCWIKNARQRPLSHGLHMANQRRWPRSRHIRNCATICDALRDTFTRPNRILGRNGKWPPQRGLEAHTVAPAAGTIRVLRVRYLGCSRRHPLVSNAKPSDVQAKGFGWNHVAGKRIQHGVTAFVAATAWRCLLDNEQSGMLRPAHNR